ncbi:MAG TPA: biotin/lipoyl-binding protein [Clostridiales bacterium]|jgi:biotin carboxyl carrier protein|nr:biotin/lipoyl-binding protein [Clostridiales bacterium]
MRRFKITVNGNTYEVAVEELNVANPVSTSSITAIPNPNPEPVKARTPQNISDKGARLNAPMPGTILKIPVKDGATVKKGDVIVVLEAMKLENDIFSPADGVVNLKVVQGATVQTGDLLAIIT